MRAPQWTDSMLVPPVWAGDFGGREHIMATPARIDPAQFNRPDSVLVDVGAAGAAIGATSVPVGALSGAIPNGTILDFGGAGKFAKLTAAAAAGATSLTVEALIEALVDADTARYAGTRELSIPSGTPIGRTLAERDNNDRFGPAVSTDDEIFLIYFEVRDADDNDEVELYRPGSQVKENFLPGWTDAVKWPALLKTALRARYQCYIGED